MFEVVSCSNYHICAMLRNYRHRNICHEGITIRKLTVYVVLNIGMWQITLNLNILLTKNYFEN
jgi:hypothetical protein